MSLEMEYDTIFAVVDSWEHLRRIDDYELVAGTKLFAKLFELCPAAKVLFGFPIDMDAGDDMMKSSARFQKHAKYMIEMLDRAINLLGPDAEMLGEILESLGKTHARMGVQPRYFPFMEEALLETLKETIGEDFDRPDVERSWKVVYGALSENIIKAMNSEQKALDSWAKLKKVDNYELEAGSLLFQKLFQKCPETKTIFGFPVDLNIDNEKILESRRFQMHAKYFISMLDRALGFVKAQEMEEHMKELGTLHCEYGVKESYFPVMGDALFHTLQTFLKEDFDEETKAAWADLYGLLSSQMISAMKASKK